MSRSVFRTALSAAFLSLLFVVAGCETRRSADYYDSLVVRLNAQGKLRTETTPQGAAYDAADLVRNFERIALHHESDAKQAGGEGNWGQNPLQRWTGPLNYYLYGAAVTTADRAEAARLMNRIAELTGLEITETETGLNFLILITTPEERGDFSADLARLSPALAATFNLWNDTPRLICVANNPFSSRDGRLISGGLVVIGSETSGILRQACLHEEIVQSLGLANDHPDVRPSIFNDDGEFALMTEHDEHLLSILYDPRLEPGMTAEEAMPIVRRIVAEIPLGRPAARLAAGAAALPEAEDDGGSRPPATQDAPAN